VAPPDPHGWASQAQGGQAALNGAPRDPASWEGMPWPAAPQTTAAPDTAGAAQATGASQATAPPATAPRATGPEAEVEPLNRGPVSNWTTSVGKGLGLAPKPGGGRIPARAALVAIPGALAGIVLAGVGAAIGQSITGSSTSGLSDLLGEAGLWVAMLATVVFVSHRFGTSSLPRDFGLGITLKDPLWGVCAAITAFLGAGLILEIFSGTKFSGSNDQILTQQKGHEAGIVLVTVIVALGAPFFEELFFRGYLRTALQARFGRHGAVWLQALFFGLAHAGEASTALGNVSVVMAMVTVGVVLGYTAMLTGRLGAGMVAHCLFNLVAVISVL
jgi:membrane protease YdiL (CAAX protease family)